MVTAAAAPKHPGGRPRAKLDLDEVEKLYALQCSDEEVAAFFNVSRATVTRLKRTQVFAGIAERGKAKGKVSVRRSLFAAAQKGNAAANIFLAKNLLGMRDNWESPAPDASKVPPIVIQIAPAPEEEKPKADANDKPEIEPGQGIPEPGKI